MTKNYRIQRSSEWEKTGVRVLQGLIHRAMLHCTEWAHQRQWTILPERFSDLGAPINLQSVFAQAEDARRRLLPHMEHGSIVSKASTPASAFRCLTSSSFYTAFVLTSGNQSRGLDEKARVEAQRVG
jgi:hypothetical protein